MKLDGRLYRLVIALTPVRLKGNRQLQTELSGIEPSVIVPPLVM